MKIPQLLTLMQAEVSVHGLPGLNQQLLQHLLSQQYARSQQRSVPTRSSGMLHNPGSPTSSISTTESFPILANSREPVQHASSKSQQTSAEMAFHRALEINVSLGTCI